MRCWMVDVNPKELQGPYMPRESTIVDAVAESRRIADQVMRNNPLVDAVVDRGLTRFRGNYGADYAWFGEFSPVDRNLTDDFGHELPQRGIVFWRDDPSHNQVFALYDFDPRAGEPLRQRWYMHDADGKMIFAEGFNGGRAFPDTSIVMYQRESFENPAATWTSDRVVYSGEGNLTGTRIEFTGAYTVSDGSSNINNYLRVSGGGVTITTSTQTVTGAQNVFWNVDVKTIQNVSDYINVEWHMWRSSGAASFLPRIYRCRALSPFARP
jgi:hypothetical protein